MALRIQLFNNKIGSVDIRKKDPIGINDLSQIVKRSEDHEGIIFEISFNLDFLDEEKDFILNCYENDGGIDTIIHALIFDKNPNSREWEHYGTGKASLIAGEFGERIVTINIDKVGVEHRVINQMNIPVSMEGLKSENGSDMIPIPHHDVLYHSKVILKETRFEVNENIKEDPERGEEYSEPGVNSHEIKQVIGIGAQTHDIDKLSYGGLGAETVRVDELLDTHPQSFGWAELPGLAGQLGTESNYRAALNPSIELRSPIFVAKEAGIMDFSTKLTYRHEVVANVDGGDIDYDDGGDSNIGQVEIFAWYEHRSSNNTLKSFQFIGQFTGSRSDGHKYISPWQSLVFKKSDVEVNLNDKFYVYETIRNFGRYRKPDRGTDTTLSHTVAIQGNPKETYISFANKTVFAPTTHKTVLAFEAVKRCVQYLTNIDDCFHSELLGRIDIGYEDDGPGSLIGFTNGWKLRNSTKAIILQLDKLLGFLNARFCIGYGFQVVEDKLKFVVEEREKFYQKAVRSISIGPVAPKRIVNEKYFYGTVEYGYAGKLDIGQTNAMDEFNSSRTAIMPVINSKNKLPLLTDIRGSGNQIEYQRRLQGKTEDSNLDDETFAICLVRDGAGYRTQSIEGFDAAAFDKISAEATQYNYYISPGRMLQAWKKHLATNCIRSHSNIIKFGNGTVNYEMVSKMTSEPDPVKENGAVEVSGIEPIYDNEDWEFNHHLTRDEWKIVKALPLAVIEVFDEEGNVYEGYINSRGIAYNRKTKTASFSLRRVNRKIIPSKEYDDNIKQMNFIDGFANINLATIRKVKEGEAPSQLSRMLTEFILLR